MIGLHWPNVVSRRFLLYLFAKVLGSQTAAQEVASKDHLALQYFQF